MNSIEQYNQMIDSLTERGFYKRLKPGMTVGVRENLEVKNLELNEVLELLKLLALKFMMNLKTYK